MSGGRFGYWEPIDEMRNCWLDEEMNGMMRDLFFGAEFSVRGYGGLFQSLDFYLSGDISRESYDEAVNGFKAKWMGRADEDRLEFYKGRLQRECDRLKAEMAGEHRCDDDDE